MAKSTKDESTAPVAPTVSAGSERQKRGKRHRNSAGDSPRISAEAFLARVKQPATLAEALRAKSPADRTFAEWRDVFSAMMNAPTQG